MIGIRHASFAPPPYPQGADLVDLLMVMPHRLPYSSLT